MISPRMRRSPPAGQLWAADNGRFSRPDLYSDERYLRFLANRLAYRGSCVFATAPDVFDDSIATLELSRPMLARIRDLGFPAAYVVQGLEAPVPWDELDAIFIGGSDAWHWSEPAFALAAEARARGKWSHNGRVNSWRRFRSVEAAGFDSADGTVLRFDPDRPVSTWPARARLEPSLWPR